MDRIKQLHAVALAITISTLSGAAASAAFKQGDRVQACPFGTTFYSAEIVRYQGMNGYMIHMLDGPNANQDFTIPDSPARVRGAAPGSAIVPAPAAVVPTGNSSAPISPPSNENVPSAPSQPPTSEQSQSTTTSASADDTSSADSNRPIADKWALVIGVSKFADPTIPSLHYAAKEATDFANFLVKHEHFAPDHVRLLVNEKATHEEIVTELEDTYLPRVVHPDDVVVFFYSSHGSPAGKTFNNENFLVAYDTKKSRPLATGIEMQELTRIIREKCKATRIVIVMDACHSGGGADGAKDSGPGGNFNLNEIKVGAGQLIISSSSEQQRSWESKRYQNGIFTHALMEGLSKNGQLTRLGDAFSHTQKTVADEVQEDEATDQIPVMNDKHWAGKQLMLGAPPTQPRTFPDAVKKLLP